MYPYHLILMTTVERKQKLELIEKIIRTKKARLKSTPKDSWYGDTFDDLYDSPVSLLNSQMRIANWSQHE